MSQNRIQILPKNTADKIAAGEVIERPASVIKELVENSIDAGASAIEVKIYDGGKSRIEITDNGSGIFKEDLPLAFERHATSKIKELSDLEKIKTMGFRGEALPSVAAVGRVTVITKAKDENLDLSTEFQLESDLNLEPKIKSSNQTYFLGKNHGTTITVDQLFYKIPVRYKFLKSNQAESSAVREIMERISLTHPAIHFRLISDEQVLLELPSQSEEERVKHLLSKEEDYPLEKMESSSLLMGLRMRAYWLRGLSLPQSKKNYQIVNGRFLKDKLLHQSMMLSFKQAMLPGQFPATCLFIEVDPEYLDVNIHPTKTEVRFLESGKIFSEVKSLFDQMVEKKGSISFLPAQSSNSFGFPQNSHSTSFWSTQSPSTYSKGSTPIFSFGRPKNEPLPFQEEEFKPETEFGVFRGQLFCTYLFFEKDGECKIVDQHAADERIRFEKLKSKQSMQAQNLLFPEVVKLQEVPEDAEKRIELLKQTGFEVENFSETSFVFRAVPEFFTQKNLKMRLQSLLERLFDGVSPKELDETLFEKIASEACHSSIRAGDLMERVEALELVKKLMNCEHPWNCPHGRPTITIIPRQKMEEWFQRLL